MVQRLSKACKAHQADRELSSADSNILELDAVVRRRQAVRPFRALDLLHCQRPPAFTRDSSAGSHQFLLAVRIGKARQAVTCSGMQIVTLPAFVRVQRLGHSQDSGALETFTSQLTFVVDKLYDLPVDSNDLMRQRFLHRQAYLELIRTEQKKRSLTAQLKRPFDFS